MNQMLQQEQLSIYPERRQEELRQLTQWLIG